MRKKYAAIFVLILSASIAFSAPSIFAEESTAKTVADTAPASTSSNAANASANTANSSTNTSNTSNTSPADNSPLRLSLDDALKMVETGNSTIILADSQIQIYDKQNQEALARQDAAKSTGVSDEDSKKDLDLNYKRAQWTLDNAKHDRDTQLKSLKAQITNEYEGVLTLQQLAENTQKQIDNLDTTIDQINLKIKLGLMVPSAIYSYNAQKSKLEASFKATNNNINSSLITLKQDLGIDLNRTVVLISPLIQYTKFDDTDIDGKIAKEIKDNYDLVRYQQDIDISQTEYDIDHYYDDTSYNQLEISIDNKKGTLQNLPATQEVNLRTAYNNLKSLENNIAADQLTVEADQINLKSMQQNIDAGVNSTLDIIPLQNTLLTDQYTLQQDINNYMTASVNFQNSLDD